MRHSLFFEGIWWEQRMESYDSEFDPSPGMWVPGNPVPRETVEQLGEEINRLYGMPEIQSHNERNWVLLFPVEQGGLSLRATQVNRSTGSGMESRQTFGLEVLRYYPEYGAAGDVGKLTRDEIVYLRDFLSAVIDETKEA